ncbi:MAG: HrpE/YscL family type III secretion apparatus protein [Ramlibacter sp.]
MAFVVSCTPPLKPQRKLSLGIDPARKIVRGEELRALRIAEEAIAHANAQADEIVEQAKAAFDAECQRGFELGKEEARLEQAELMIENVSRTVDYFSKVEGRMVDLVMQAVRKIVEDFDDQERVLITVRSVLSVVRNQKQMTLRLSPQQVDVVKGRINELLAAYPGVGYVDIVADNRLKADACILESEIGLVEASMEGQLTALRNAFQKVLGSRV